MLHDVIGAGVFSAHEDSEASGKSDVTRARKLIRMIYQFGQTLLHQLEITRPAPGKFLHLVLCSSPNLVMTAEVKSGMSDHLAVITALEV